MFYTEINFFLCCGIFVLLKELDATKEVHTVLVIMKEENSFSVPCLLFLG